MSTPGDSWRSTTAQCQYPRRVYNVVDIVNWLETEIRNGRLGGLVELLARIDLIVLDELGCLPFSQSGAELLFNPQPDLRAHLRHLHHQTRPRRMAERVRR